MQDVFRTSQPIQYAHNSIIPLKKKKKNLPKNRNIVGVLVGAQQELSAGVKLEVPRSAPLGVAVAHDR